jgi:hypothetical protein
MSTCIISGRFPETEFKSYINHKAYADTYGFSYIHCNWPTTLKNNYLNKIEYILAYIDSFDTIVWIDDDAFFFDFEKNILDFAPRGDFFISLCKSPSYKKLKTVFSSGQFIIKSNELSKRFLKEILKTNLQDVKKWWYPELGYFTNGDQDVMIYLLLEDVNYKNKTQIYDYKCFNSRVENIFNIDLHKPLILHFTGHGKAKHRSLNRVQEKLNLHPSLVPNTILKKYKIDILERYPVSNSNSKKKTLLMRLVIKLQQWLQD